MVSKRVRQLLEEKSQRVKEVIAVKQPDRVPVCAFADIFYVANQTKLTHRDIMHKSFKASRAWFDVYSRYDFDLHPAFFVPYSGRMNDLTNHLCLKYPGAKNPDMRLGDHQPYQFREVEWMKPDEYKWFNSDMTGFLIKELMPRQNLAFKGLSTFPSASNIAGFGNLFIPYWFAMDKEAKKLKKTLSTMNVMKAMIGNVIGQMLYNKRMTRAGNILPHMCGLTMSPFDFFANVIRGMRGTMLDMKRQPEELKRAIDIITDDAIRCLGDSDEMFGTPSPYSISMSMMAIHRGSDPFMSNEQFGEFYWPSFSRLMEAMIEKGYTPMPFLEGKNDDRVPFFAEFAKNHPKKCIFWFDRTDLKRVKEEMGDYVCIRGNVPGSLLVTGTPLQVEEYVKKEIEDCGDGGGLMIDGGVSGICNDAKHENVVAMVRAAQKYGVYKK